VKTSLRWFAVALFLTTISVPALMATSPDGSPTGPPPIKHASPPDGNPWPHMTGGRR
jgi:hypothetical protein